MPALREDASGEMASTHADGGAAAFVAPRDPPVRQAGTT
jgi:hypothetical protein